MARSIVIGDTHGCADELRDLLSIVGFGTGDRLFFVGDMLSRGPDWRGVLKIFRDTGARSVLGNHEQRLIAAHTARLRNDPLPKLSASHAEILREMDDADHAELAALPLWLDLPEHALRLVHAGLMPGVPMAEQDPWLLTHIRSIEDDGSPSERWGKPWGRRYKGPPHVVFGHNARKSPQLHADVTGIDTGCVYGGALTALVLPAGAAIPPMESRAEVLVSVPARRAYVDYGRPLGGD
ncbi:MAG TPA: hypothetical protein VGM29_12940 [Polyangiaceae bacterium]